MAPRGPRAASRLEVPGRGGGEWGSRCASWRGLSPPLVRNFTRGSGVRLPSCQARAGWGREAPAAERGFGLAAYAAPAPRDAGQVSQDPRGLAGSGHVGFVTEDAGRPGEGALPRRGGGHPRCPECGGGDPGGDWGRTLPTHAAAWVSPSREDVKRRSECVPAHSNAT